MGEADPEPWRRGGTGLGLSEVGQGDSDLREARLSPLGWLESHALPCGQGCRTSSLHVRAAGPSSPSGVFPGLRASRETAGKTQQRAGRAGAPCQCRSPTNPGEDRGRGRWVHRPSRGARVGEPPKAVSHVRAQDTHQRGPILGSHREWTGRSHGAEAPVTPAALRGRAAGPPADQGLSPALSPSHLCERQLWMAAPLSQLVNENPSGQHCGHFILIMYLV